MKNNKESTVIFGNHHLSIEDICAIANGSKKVRLSEDNEWIGLINSGSSFLSQMLADQGVIYGVTTGYGDSCTVSIPAHLVEELPVHLTRFHGCGLGNFLAVDMATAVLAVRLSSLSMGYSGVRMEILEQIAACINNQIIPVIPEEGSVGASGDLTPLSYLAAVLIGEREVYYKGHKQSSSSALADAGLAPVSLHPKEGLALMNGTSVMTAMACQAYDQAEYMTRLCSRITSMAVLALKGNVSHYKESIFKVKPHLGQARIAAWIRADLSECDQTQNPARLQDRYSIRCAPHIIGVLRDALPWMKTTIETELNSTNDNPIIDSLNREILHSGHFYGGHIAFVMDAMKNAVANLADLMDRQLALLVDTKFNNGLPANLSGSIGDRSLINHGFKAVQIGVSAWTAEALKLTMPASVFSRSTECHNQDKVSMGTISARDCLRVMELTRQVAAACLMAVVQAVDLRAKQERVPLGQGINEMNAQVKKHFAFLDEDRPLDATLRDIIRLIELKEIELYEN